MSFRSFLYRLAAFLGDVNAVRRGTVPQRVGRRLVWRLATRLLKRGLR